MLVMLMTYPATKTTSTGLSIQCSLALYVHFVVSKDGSLLLSPHAGILLQCHLPVYHSGSVYDPPSLEGPEKNCNQCSTVE